MDTKLDFDISRQPDDYTCGPTCLHAVYRYYGDAIPMSQVLDETRMLVDGGTLAVFLACHALRRGYRAKIYTYNLVVFDPTWFVEPRPRLAERLARQAAAKSDPKLREATEGYLEFLERGGELCFEDLGRQLIRSYLTRGMPILTGLSATFLHRSAREFGPNQDSDDVRGEPSGHFVVLSGYDQATRSVLVADPLTPNPYSSTPFYPVAIDRVIGAILLGILTYDANLLIVRPPTCGARP